MHPYLVKMVEHVWLIIIMLIIIVNVHENILDRCVVCRRKMSFIVKTDKIRGFSFSNTGDCLSDRLLYQ